MAPSLNGLIENPAEATDGSELVSLLTSSKSKVLNKSIKYESIMIKYYDKILFKEMPDISRVMVGVLASTCPSVRLIAAYPLSNGTPAFEDPLLTFAPADWKRNMKVSNSGK